MTKIFLGNLLKLVWVRRHVRWGFDKGQGFIQTTTTPHFASKRLGFHRNRLKGLDKFEQSMFSDKNSKNNCKTHQRQTAPNDTGVASHFASLASNFASLGVCFWSCFFLPEIHALCFWSLALCFWSLALCFWVLRCVFGRLGVYSHKKPVKVDQLCIKTPRFLYFWSHIAKSVEQ